MPHYSKPGQMAPFNLAHWLGWWAGAGAAKIGREVEFLATRAKHSSGSERADWVKRCAIAGILIGAEIVTVRLVDDVGVLPLSAAMVVATWVVLWLLPAPTPRLLLLVGRIVAVGATLAITSQLFDSYARRMPAAKDWEGTFAVLWGISSGALGIWALLALRRSRDSQPTARAGRAETQQQTPEHRFQDIPDLTFRDVGGSMRAKEEIAAIAQGIFRRRGSHQRMRNGILLYGPQGTGKSLIAEATAGEYGVNFLHVRCPDLVGQFVGSTGAEIRAAFESAAANRPVIIFLDEIDAIGSRRQAQGQGTDAGGAGREYNTVTTQLMSAIDKYRSMDGLLIMAATNQLDGLEPTLIREGRFDLKLRLDLPDEEGRKQILAALLVQSKWRPFDLAGLARRTPNWSPARLRALVDRASELADGRPIEEHHVLRALESSGGRDRPPMERIGWDDVVLPEAVVHDLKALIELMQPGRAEKLSLPAPTGLILTGAPGTGKTLTAKMIASQANRSFYALSPSDILSGEIGGSTKRLKDAFARAKEHAPSILFFDEMDGLFPAVHGPVGQHDVQLVEQALIEINALRPEHHVFLVGTTNYIARVDPRIVRGGRFSEKIELGAPDDSGYAKLLARFLGTASLSVRLPADQVIERIRGMSPADLEATVLAAKRSAMRRMGQGADILPPLETGDFDAALARVRAIV